MKTLTDLQVENLAKSLKIERDKSWKNFLIRNWSWIFVWGRIPEKLIISLIFENWDLIDYDQSILELLNEEEKQQIKDWIIKNLTKIENERKEKEKREKINYYSINQKNRLLLFILLILSMLMTILSFSILYSSL